MRIKFNLLYVNRINMALSLIFIALSYLFLSKYYDNFVTKNILLQVLLPIFVIISTWSTLLFEPRGKDNILYSIVIIGLYIYLITLYKFNIITNTVPKIQEDFFQIFIFIIAPICSILLIAKIIYFKIINE